MRQLRWGLLVSLGLSLTLAACGGGSLGGDDGGGDGGTSTTYQFGYLFQGSFSSGVIGAKSNSLEAGGSTTLQVDVVDGTGARVTGTDAEISFTSDCVAAGTSTIDPASSTVTNGTLTVTYTAAGCEGDDNITATARVGNQTLEAYTTLSIAAAVTPTYRLGYLFQGSFSSGVIGAKSSSLAAGAATTLTVDVVDDTGARVSGTDAEITFTSECIKSGSAITTPASATVTGGTLTVTYTAEGCEGEDNITATAKVGGQTLEAYTTLTIAQAAASYSAGVLVNDTLNEGALGIGVPELTSNGQSSLYIDIVDDAGVRINGITATASFTSNCIVGNLATVTSNPATSTNGRINATYTAAGCVGEDLITGIVSVDGTSLTVTGVISISPPEFGNLTFNSAEPTVIGISGSTVNNQSVLTFTVTDVTGAPLAGQNVLFAFDGDAKGAVLTPTSATSNASGVVTTVVTAGSTHTVVRVFATANSATTGESKTQQSDQLVISTGFPDQNSMSLSADRLSVSDECDGEPVSITVRAGDRYNTAIPDNTAVSFNTDGGKVAAQCFTATATQNGLPDAGVCSVLLTVQNPRPENGRTAVLATMRGEESFSDANANGYYDSGETFGDSPEAFNDENESGVYDPDEYFLDYNGNSIHDGPDGSFTGYVCDSPGVNCKSSLLDIFQQINIVFSTDVPKYGALTVNASCSGSAPGCGYRALTNTLTWTSSTDAADVLIGVSDTNGNPLPTGTTYTLKVDVGSVYLPSSATLGPYNTSIAGLTGLNYGIKAPADATEASGSAILQIAIPGTACGDAKIIETKLFNIVYSPS